MYPPVVQLSNCRRGGIMGSWYHTPSVTGVSACASFSNTKGLCPTSVVKVCVGTRCVNLQKHSTKRTQQKRWGARNSFHGFVYRSSLVCVLEVWPAGTSSFGHTFLVFSALCSSSLVLPGGSFRDAVPYRSCLSCRPKRSFVRAGAAIFRFALRQRRRGTKSLRTPPLSLE